MASKFREGAASQKPLQTKGTVGALMIGSFFLGGGGEGGSP